MVDYKVRIMVRAIKKRSENENLTPEEVIEKHYSTLSEEDIQQILNEINK